MTKNERGQNKHKLVSDKFMKFDKEISFVTSPLKVIPIQM